MGAISKLFESATDSRKAEAPNYAKNTVDIAKMVKLLVDTNIFQDDINFFLHTVFNLFFIGSVSLTLNADATKYDGCICSTTQGGVTIGGDNWYDSTTKTLIKFVSFLDPFVSKVRHSCVRNAWCVFEVAASMSEPAKTLHQAKGLPSSTPPS